MNCQACEELLGDYVDGTLASEDEPRVASHVASCARCQAMVTDFTTLRTAVHGLEPATPAGHVWTRVSAAVAADRERSTGAWWRFASLDAVTLRLLGGSPMAGVRPLLAGVAMVAVLAGGTWFAWREVSQVQSQRSAQTSAAAAQATAQATATFESELRLAEEHYTKAIASLEQITQSDSGALDSTTAQVLQTNLAVIDTAIGQSRDALQKEPASDAAQESLFEALRSKVVLLQNTVALINEMRKGNSEGAARIMSGLKQ